MHRFGILYAWHSYRVPADTDAPVHRRRHRPVLLNR